MLRQIAAPRLAPIRSSFRRVCCTMFNEPVASIHLGSEDHAGARRRHDELLGHLTVNRDDRVQTSAMHGDDVVGVDVLEGGNGFGDDFVGGCGQMEAAYD